MRLIFLLAVKAALALSGSNCSSDHFPVNLVGVQCFGLGTSSGGSQADCEQACCNDPLCKVYSYCPANSLACGKLSPVATCMTGPSCSVDGNCSTGNGAEWCNWFSYGVAGVPTPYPNCSIFVSWCLCLEGRGALVMLFLDCSRRRRRRRRCRTLHASAVAREPALATAGASASTRTSGRGAIPSTTKSRRPSGSCASTCPGAPSSRRALAGSTTSRHTVRGHARARPGITVAADRAHLSTARVAPDPAVQSWAARGVQVMFILDYFSPCYESGNPWQVQLSVNLGMSLFGVNSPDSCAARRPHASTLMPPTARLQWRTTSNSRSRSSSSARTSPRARPSGQMPTGQFSR